MTKSIFQTQDFKAITTASVLALTKAFNEADDQRKKDKVIFVTSFGYVIAESIENTTDIEEPKNPDDIAMHALQDTIKNRNEILSEFDNQEILNSNTSLLLKNVQIKTYDGHTSNLPVMLLFSDSIQGLTFGNLS
ncbi:hypothetical protein [Lysinibacillus capsici]|uniref:hypothetical protein n=1 Tax=Lysinibacillus capsici TaxID=2115968 RepID=UPI003081C121|nr:hypothetical protein ICJ70_01420 [Lysinibacillus capsici]